MKLVNSSPSLWRICRFYQLNSKPGSFLEFLVTLVSLLRREKEEIEIVASSSESYKGYDNGNYSFGGIFFIKFLCNCTWIYVNSFTQIYNLFHVKRSQTIPFSTLWICYVLYEIVQSKLIFTLWKCYKASTSQKMVFL